jgi:hypothetical protein
MMVKRNRQNNNFQIAYFIAGSCFTADAAYFALLNQRDDRQRSLDSARVQAIRMKSRLLDIARRIESPDPVIQLNAQADQLEIDLSQDASNQLIAACEDELAFIDLCIERVQPLRKYADMPDAQAVEQCQREETAREFQFRIENYMITQGSLPHNELATMRQHPDFANQLLPYITHVTQALSAPGGAEHLLPNLTKSFDLPALVGYDHAT